VKGKDVALFFPLTVLPFEKQLAAPGSLGLVIPLYNYRSVLLTGRWSGKRNFRKREEREGEYFSHGEKAHPSGN
jgi:hypothetical protein